MRALMLSVRHVVVGLAVLALVAAALPARQADASAPPFISASWSTDWRGSNVLYVEGHLFTPGGTVVVQVYQDYAVTPLIETTTTATAPGVWSARGGDFSLLLSDPTRPGGSFRPYAGLTVIAYDKATGDGNKVFLKSNCPW